MLGLFRALFSFIGELARYFADRQLIDAGKAEGAVEAMKEVEASVQKADAAIRTVDHDRSERLRDRFDRSRSRS